MVPTSAFAGFVAPNSCRAIKTTRSAKVAAGGTDTGGTKQRGQVAARQTEPEGRRFGFGVWVNTQQCLMGRRKCP